MQLSSESADQPDKAPPGRSLRAAALQLLAAVFAGTLIAMLTASETLAIPRPVLAALTLTLLTIGTWPALSAVGKLADAALPPRSMAERLRIAGDPYVGSLGTSAIALALLVEYAALVGAPSLAQPPLAALPLLAVLSGAVVAEATHQGPAWSVTWCLALVVFGLALALFGHLHRNPAGILGWCLVAGPIFGGITGAIVGRDHWLVGPFACQAAVVAGLFATVA